MTSEQPIDQPPEERPAPPSGASAAPGPSIGASSGAPVAPEPAIGLQRLRRRVSDRVIGGVAGGLGDYLNVDPILLRVGFAGLMIFGGAGLVLYVLGWLLIPAAGTDESIAQGALRLMARRIGRLGVLVVIVAAVIILSPSMTDRYSSLYIQPEVFWALAIALIGVVLLLPRDQRAAATAAGGAGMAAWPQATAPAVRAPRTRERSPLGWYILAAVLVALGALAVVDTAVAVRVVPAQYFGAGFLALGVGLVVAAWWGRARFVGLLGLVILPLAAGSAFVTVPLEGGFGDRDYQPRSVAEIQPAYHVVSGQLRLDLSHLGAGSSPVSLEATVGVGDLYVIVPRDAAVKVTGTVQGGQLWLFGRQQVGTWLSDRVSDPGSGGGTLVLTLDAGIGRVWIERSTVEGN